MGQLVPLYVSRHARAREGFRQFVDGNTEVSRHARAREVPQAWGGVNLRPPLQLLVIGFTHFLPTRKKKGTPVSRKCLFSFAFYGG